MTAETQRTQRRTLDNSLDQGQLKMVIANDPLICFLVVLEWIKTDADSLQLIVNAWFEWI